MISFHLTNIDDNIQKGLDLRKELYNSDNRSKALWVYSKTPWVRMYSNAIVAKGSQAKAYQDLVSSTSRLTSQQREAFNQKYPDINGTTSRLFDYSARKSSVLGSQTYANMLDSYNENFRLVPGIAKVSVSTQGALGSLRRAIIEFTVWSKEDLDRLEPFYFIPGMSVILEWGWSITEQGQVVVPVPIQEPILPDDQMRCMIHKNRKKFNGNYDGMQGLVVNFTYTLNSNSGWDCVLELVSSADVFLSVPIHGTTEKYKKDGEDDEQSVTGDTIAIHLKEMIKDATRYIKTSKISNSTNSPILRQLKDHIFRIKINASSRTPDLDENQSLIDSTKEAILNFNTVDAVSSIISSTQSTASSIFGSPVLGSPTTVETFVTFDLFIALLNQFLTLKSGDGKSQICKIDISGIDGKGVLVGDHPALGSCDPYVCILSKRPQFVPLPAVSVSGNQLPAYTGRLNQILLNATMLYTAFKESEDLKSYLQNVLGLINTACGSYFNFELQEPPENVCDNMELKRQTKNTVVITITNTNLTNPSNQVRPYPLRYHDKIFRGLAAKSKLTDSMKAQALYGMNSARSSETTDVQITSERFYRLTGRGDDGAGIVVRNGSIPFDVIVGVMEDYSPPGYTKVEENDSPSLLLIKAYQKLQAERTDTTVESAQRAMIDYFNSKQDHTTGNSKTANLILPFEISITIDGIGGIVWGNTLDVSDILPSRLGNMFVYQATVIEHEISNISWDTTINTVPRYKE